MGKRNVVKIIVSFLLAYCLGSGVGILLGNVSGKKQDYNLRKNVARGPTPTEVVLVKEKGEKVLGLMDYLLPTPTVELYSVDTELPSPTVVIPKTGPSDSSTTPSPTGLLPTPIRRPSKDNPQKTIESLLEVIKRGEVDDYRYFVVPSVYQAGKIHLVPDNWNIKTGNAVIIEKIPADGHTFRVMVIFTSGVNGSEKIGYFLGRSGDNEFLIFDSVVEP